MNKREKHPILTVAGFEIIRQLKKPSFWIALLLMPVLLVSIMAISAISGYKAGELADSGIATDDKTLGLTDDAQLIQPDILKSLTEPTDSSDTDALTFQLFENRESGLEAVRSGKIDIFYYIPPDFSAETPIEYYIIANRVTLLASYDAPLRSVLQASAASTTTPINAVILSDAYSINQHTIDTDGNSVNLRGKAIPPLAVLVIFYLLICVFGNRLMMAVVEEKENRISEMILTAVSAKHLIIGKLIALIALGFLQIIILIAPIICLILLNQSNPVIAGLLSAIEFEPVSILTNLALLFSSYFLFAGLSTLVGSLVPTAREASQYISPIIIGIILPLFFLDSFMTDTPSLLLYILSYFPLSAPITLMLRNTFGLLPWYELLIGLVELTLASIVVIHLTVKTFQANAINFSVVKPNFKPRKTWKN